MSPTSYNTRPVVNTTYSTRPWIGFIMTEVLDFLMTEDDKYLITDESIYTSYSVRPII